MCWRGAVLARPGNPLPLAGRRFHHISSPVITLVSTPRQAIVAEIRVSSLNWLPTSASTVPRPGRRSVGDCLTGELVEVERALLG